nr:DUF333 domain-containing protein [Caballeronia sp. BCC1704]
MSPVPSATDVVADQPASRPDSHVRLANPASTNCIRQGGTLQIVDSGDGQIGMCRFPGGKSCEEWALLRGQCSPDQKLPVLPGRVSSVAQRRWNFEIRPMARESTPSQNLTCPKRNRGNES